MVEFRAQCGGAQAKNIIFYAEVKSKVISSSCDESGERYQLTWTDRNEVSRSGQIDLKIYDEDGVTALKKAQRAQTDTNQVKELQTVSFYHAVIMTKTNNFRDDLFARWLLMALFYLFRVGIISRTDHSDRTRRHDHSRRNLLLGVHGQESINGLT